MVDVKLEPQRVVHPAVQPSVDDPQDHVRAAPRCRRHPTTPRGDEGVQRLASSALAPLGATGRRSRGDSDGPAAAGNAPPPTPPAAAGTAERLRDQSWSVASSRVRSAEERRAQRRLAYRARTRAAPLPPGNGSLLRGGGAGPLPLCTVHFPTLRPEMQMPLCARGITNGYAVLSAPPAVVADPGGYIEP